MRSERRKDKGLKVEEREKVKNGGEGGGALDLESVAAHTGKVRLDDLSAVLVCHRWAVIEEAFVAGSLLRRARAASGESCTVQE